MLEEQEGGYESMKGKEEMRHLGRVIHYNNNAPCPLGSATFSHAVLKGLSPTFNLCVPRKSITFLGKDHIPHEWER